MVSPASTVATDEQLVAAAREGSDEAFEALFRRYRDRIGVHVRGMVHDRGRAEDIVQDTLAGRDSSEMWMVSLQRFHGGWDAFIEGPDPTLAARMTQALRKAGFAR